MAMNRILMLAGILLLAGCSLAPQRPAAITYHVLGDPGPASAQAGPTSPPLRATLLLRETDASPFYQSSAIVYARTADSRAYYQYARWESPLAPRLTLLMRQRLAGTGLFEHVADVGTGVRGTLQLNTRLLDGYHDASQPPGTVHLVVEAELVDRATGRLLGRRQFASEAPAASFNARGAAEGMQLATGQLLDQLVQWISRVRPAEAR